MTDPAVPEPAGAPASIAASSSPPMKRLPAVPEPVASAAAHRGLWSLGGCGAEKHAVLGLVRGLVTDVQGTGVSAVAVSPGSTRTAMLRATADLYHLADEQDLAQHQLVHRVLEPDEVAAAIAWLCSPDASAVNGSVLHADGGFSG